MRDDREAIFGPEIPLERRIIFLVVLVVCLFPILAGGVAAMQNRMRANWMQMRREHMMAVERDHLRHQQAGRLHSVSF